MEEPIGQSLSFPETSCFIWALCWFASASHFSCPCTFPSASFHCYFSEHFRGKVKIYSLCPQLTKWIFFSLRQPLISFFFYFSSVQQAWVSLRRPSQRKCVFLCLIWGATALCPWPHHVTLFSQLKLDCPLFLSPSSLPSFAPAPSFVICPSFSSP